jgi:hypothetical protein
MKKIGNNGNNENVASIIMANGWRVNVNVAKENGNGIWHSMAYQRKSAAKQRNGNENGEKIVNMA